MTCILAGAAKADITPPMGIQIDGDIGRRRPVEIITDRLYARVLMIGEAGGPRLCLLSLDLLATTTARATDLRRRVADRCGLDPACVAVHVTQNHSAPSLGRIMLSDDCPHVPPGLDWLRGGGDPRYEEPCLDAIVEAACQAAAAMEPVTLWAGRAADGRVAFNRRFVMRDGTARTHPPPGSPDILHAEGPVDPEVGVLVLKDRADRPRVALLHHTCHPVHGYPSREVIADWPGAWCARMESTFGPDCMPLVVNGCCGNVHHTNHLDPHPVRDYRRMAALLAESAGLAFSRLQPISTARGVAGRRTVVRLPFRNLTREEVAAARQYLQAHPEPVWREPGESVEWDWMFAVSTLDLLERQKRTAFFPYEIQAWRIGEFGLVTLMGEPFVEAQLELKRRAPAPFTFVAHFCNGYAGYLPTRAAYARGGYETRTSNGSQFNPGTLERVTTRAAALQRAVFKA